jgi:hypothetical protein
VLGLLAGSAAGDQFPGTFHTLFVAPVQVCPAAGGADASANKQVVTAQAVRRVRSMSASKVRDAGRSLDDWCPAGGC